MPEIFPEIAPGSFTYDEAMGKWVMTVFNTYQWDLNYSNPDVFIAMVDNILFWANQGVDIIPERAVGRGAEHALFSAWLRYINRCKSTCSFLLN